MSSLLFKLLVGKGGGASPLIINQSAPLFFDTFDNTDTSLTGRSGWTAAGDATRAGKIKSADGMARMKTGSNGDTPPGFQVTADLGAQNRRITFEYDFTQTSGGTLSNSATPLQYYDQQWILAWIDSSNYTYAQAGALSGATMRVTVYKNVAGAAAEIFRFNNLPIAGTMTFELSDRIRCICNDLVRVPDMLYTDSAINFYPDRKFSGGTNAIRTGASGFKHCFHPLAIVQSWKTELLDTMRVNDPQPFYGRSDTNDRLITFTGTYSGSPLSWAYRLRRRSTGAVVKDWTAFTPTAGAGVWSADLTIAAGGPYLADFGWTGADNLTRITTSNYFAVGILICVWGQSEAGFATSVNGTPGYGGNDLLFPYCYYSSYRGTTTQRWMDDLTPESRQYNTNVVGICKSLSDATGLPVGAAAIGVAGQAIGALLPGGALWNSTLVPMVTAIGGNVEHWIWWQGQAEALSLSSYASYASDFATLKTGLATLGGRAGAKFSIQLVGKDTDIVNDSTKTARAQGFRSLQVSLVNGTDTFMGSSALGSPLRDNIHYTDAGCVALLRREGMSIANRMYGSLAYDGRGPLVTSASRALAVITLAIDLNGASGISGAALTGYEVSNDDFSTNLTISSATVTANQIVITLSGVPSGTVKVRSFAQGNYDDSSLAVGAYPDSVTIPVFPIVNPITVSTP